MKMTAMDIHIFKKNQKSKIKIYLKLIFKQIFLSNKFFKQIFQTNLDLPGR